MSLSGVARVIVPVVLAVAVTGCLRFKQQPTTGAAATTPKVNVLGPFTGAKRVIDQAELKELGIYYHNAIANGKPPANLDELGIKQDKPTLYQAIADGHIIVYWNANPLKAVAGTSNTVLAYDADVPTKGGAALMLDGSTRKMSSEEFRSEAKAGQ